MEKDTIGLIFCAILSMAAVIGLVIYRALA